MEHPYAHTATLRTGPGADPRAPGGAITLALCGSWSHDGRSCVWPHLTEQEAAGPDLLVRTAFTADPEDESRVRQLIEAALRGGTCVGPDGRTSTWTVVASGPADPDEDER